jgi:hypothetical protein
MVMVVVMMVMMTVRLPMLVRICEPDTGNHVAHGHVFVWYPPVPSRDVTGGLGTPERGNTDLLLWYQATKSWYICSAAVSGPDSDLSDMQYLIS